jgi:rhamnopyranosyl-N-acetylglucosaminyl-diphospho-decaprenol beta-1,3/1,4-galactofuranosyltransferase
MRADEVAVEVAVEVADEDAPEQVTVLAMVLTHNSPRTLARTLEALGAQTRLPDAVLILDNASDPPAGNVVEEWEHPPHLDVRVVRESENSGPAGGWARLLEEFLRSTYDLAWILDDDIVAPPDCLALLLKEYEEMGGSACVIPSVRTPTGLITHYPGWCGVLVARDVVASVGLPRADFFWWAEDFEYLMLRIPGAGHPMRITPDVVVEHQQGRGQWGNPPWKYYYEARNNVYVHVYIKHGRGRWPRKLAGLTARAVLREEDMRTLRLKMIGRGVVDGVGRRLGRRVEPSQASEASGAQR